MSSWLAGVLFGGVLGFIVGVLAVIGWGLSSAPKQREVHVEFRADTEPFRTELSATTRRADEAWGRLRADLDSDPPDHVPDDWVS